MAARDNRIDHADREASRALATIGREIREARTAAGLSQRVVGHKIGISHAQVSRLERGRLPFASIRVLARLSSAVGLDISLRAYPGGDPIRDESQVRLLGRFRRHLHPDLRWRTEVPMPLVGDKRAWDAVVGGHGWSVAVEAETRLSDLQAMLRRLELKRRDGGIDSVVLLLADTRTNRSALRAVRPVLGDAFPASHGSVLAALERGDQPPNSGIVVL